jgi:hypothetical protein
MAAQKMGRRTRTKLRQQSQVRQRVVRHSLHPRPMSRSLDRIITLTKVLVRPDRRCRLAPQLRIGDRVCDSAQRWRASAFCNRSVGCAPELTAKYTTALIEAGLPPWGCARHPKTLHAPPSSRASLQPTVTALGLGGDSDASLSPSKLAPIPDAARLLDITRPRPARRCFDRRHSEHLSQSTQLARLRRWPEPLRHVNIPDACHRHSAKAFRPITRGAGGGISYRVALAIAGAKLLRSLSIATRS